MAQRLLLIRHGQVETSHVGRLIGATDVALSAVGHCQAAALAPRIRRWAPDRCFCSPMQRCRQTAEATLPGRAVTIDDDLREIHFGQCENRTFAEVARDTPAVAAGWAAMEPDFGFPGGERIDRFFARVCGVADRLAAQDEPTVLAVAHGGVIRAMLCHFLGLATRQYLLFDIGYASTVAIDLVGEGRGVLAALVPLEPGPIETAEDGCG
jgi:broad specificity phosphatase PhoE